MNERPLFFSAYRRRNAQDEMTRPGSHVSLGRDDKLPKRDNSESQAVNPSWLSGSEPGIADPIVVS